MSNSRRRKTIKARRWFRRRMEARRRSPEAFYRVSQNIADAQGRMIARRDPLAFDLVAIAAESLGADPNW